MERASKEPGVARVGLECRVGEDINERDEADGLVEGEVEQHAGDDAGAQAEADCLADEVKANKNTNPVSNDRHQPDDGVVAEAPLRAGYREPLIEQVRDAIGAAEGGLVGVGLARASAALVCDAISIDERQVLFPITK